MKMNRAELVESLAGLIAPGFDRAGARRDIVSRLNALVALIRDEAVFAASNQAKDAPPAVGPKEARPGEFLHRPHSSVTDVFVNYSGRLTELRQPDATADRSVTLCPLHARFFANNLLCPGIVIPRDFDCCCEWMAFLTYHE